MIPSFICQSKSVIAIIRSNDNNHYYYYKYYKGKHTHNKHATNENKRDIIDQPIDYIIAYHSCCTHIRWQMVLTEIALAKYDLIFYQRINSFSAKKTHAQIHKNIKQFLWTNSLNFFVSDDVFDFSLWMAPLIICLYKISKGWSSMKIDEKHKVISAKGIIICVSWQVTLLELFNANDQRHHQGSRQFALWRPK